MKYILIAFLIVQGLAGVLLFGAAALKIFFKGDFGADFGVFISYALPVLGGFFFIFLFAVILKIAFGPLRVRVVNDKDA